MANEILPNHSCNMDVASLCRRLDRIVVEITHSNSAPLTTTWEADLLRLRKYLQSVQSYADLAAKKPQEDWSKSGSAQLPLPTPPGVPPMENDDMWDLAQKVDSIRFEIANSNSSRAPSGIEEPDKIRFDSYIAACVKFIDDHVVKLKPMDFPESAPSIPIPVQGALGV